MEATSRGVIMHHKKTGLYYAVESGRVYEMVTRIEITGTALANSAILKLKMEKERLRDRKNYEDKCGIGLKAINEELLCGVRKALYPVGDKRRNLK